ncbi:hypothetical protein AJ80_06308 [Polytolypa hystricis UAMH7299]|uniref:Protein kinase domain-containing protein n=1 Tax=Polytolypa hystricis (strain UAMH7299) TaxID=1447883 RepID=A0A2B7XWX8_POLH7|nr:hypothetical protein AJ80_06308 [Polytolypa hystricis UAMH7299]
MTTILSDSDSYNTRFNIPKPRLPYKVDQHLSVRAHVPPEPTNSDCCLKFEARRERESIDPVGRCGKHPPLPGVFTSGAAELKTVRLVRAADGYSAQLLAVRVLSSDINLPYNTDLLVKKYDPLHSDHEQDEAAYAKLADFQGSLIPRYYGSFSLSLSIDGTSSREVRLILLEFVPGTCMVDLDPSKFTQSERQAIMKEVIDAETTIYIHDVAHNDIHPRNVILVSFPPFDQARNIVLVDFGVAWVNRVTFPKFQEQFLLGVPISPLLRWIDIERLSGFDNWIDWDWKLWVEHNYEHTRGSITEYMQEVFGPRDRGARQKASVKD